MGTFREPTVGVREIRVDCLKFWARVSGSMNCYSAEPFRLQCCKTLIGRVPASLLDSLQCRLLWILLWAGALEDAANLCVKALRFLVLGLTCDSQSLM